MLDNVKAMSRLKSCQAVLQSPSKGQAAATAECCQVDSPTANVVARQVDKFAPVTEVLKRHQYTRLLYTVSPQKCARFN